MLVMDGGGVPHLERHQLPGVLVQLLSSGQVASCHHHLPLLQELGATLSWPGLIGMRSLILLSKITLLLDMVVSGSGLLRWASRATRNLLVSRVPCVPVLSLSSLFAALTAPSAPSIVLPMGVSKQFSLSVYPHQKKVCAVGSLDPYWVV